MYYYGMIIRNIFFFPVPEAGTLQQSYDNGYANPDGTFELRNYDEEFIEKFQREFTDRLKEILQKDD